MKFITNTKPLCDALALGIVDSNVSKFHNKSVIVQLSATRNELIINIEADRIKTEIRLKGSGDADSSPIAMVESLTFKKLVSSFPPTVPTTIEFVEGGIVVTSGSSKFTLPNKAQAENSTLDRPVVPDYNQQAISIKPDDWKYVQSKQMFAIAMNFTNPMYTLVYVGDDGKVLVGDTARAVFSQSSKSNFPGKCLFKDSIINLLASLPEGAKMVKAGDSYVLNVSSDEYTLTTEILPMYESDEFGSYNSELIENIFSGLEDYVEIDPNAVKLVLSQADLLSTNIAADILVKIDDGKLLLKDSSVESKLDVKGTLTGVECRIATKLLGQAFSKFESDLVKIYAHYVDSGDGESKELSGLIMTDGELFVVLAGNE